MASFSTFLGVCCFLFPLFSTVNEPLKVSFYSGYRNDKLHSHLQEGGTGLTTYSENEKGIEFWQNGIYLKTIHRDFAFYLQGNYSAFGRGNVTQKYKNVSFTGDPLNFSYSTTGFATDAEGLFGYAVNLTPDRTYKTLLIPQVGYSFFFEQLKRKGNTTTVSGNDFMMTSSLPGRQNVYWYGFFTGGWLYLEPSQLVSLLLGYDYHFLKHSLRSEIQNRVRELSGDDLASEILESNDLKAHAGAVGQSGLLELTYAFSRSFQVGIGGRILYFSTKDASAREEISQTTLFPDPGSSTFQRREKYKMRFASVSGWMNLIYEF